jgi:peptidyl-prolyl cis-trans isomerase C
MQGCGGRDEDPVLARVGRVNITQSDLNKQLAALPEFSRQQYSGPEGMIDLLERMVEQEVLYQAALRAGYDKAPQVVRSVEAVERQEMIRAYYRDEIEGSVEIPESEILAYYEEHSELFDLPARVKFRHIMTNSEAEAARAKRRVLEGEAFDAVARDVSTHAATRKAGGLVQWITVGSGYSSAGMDAKFISDLFDWKVGEMTDPLQSKRGWHIVRIEAKEEDRRTPIEEARDRILQNLKPGRVRAYYQQAYEELKTKSNATINEEFFRSKPRTEEELFTLAQETEDPVARLDYYSELAFNYPDGEHADEAQFMIGFIQAEELGNYPAAENAFERMLEKYPESELAESARWMIENMGEETPPFEEPGATVPD